MAYGFQVWLVDTTFRTTGKGYGREQNAHRMDARLRMIKKWDSHRLAQNVGFQLVSQRFVKQDALWVCKFFRTPSVSFNQVTKKQKLMEHVVYNYKAARTHLWNLETPADPCFSIQTFRDHNIWSNHKALQSTTPHATDKLKLNSGSPTFFDCYVVLKDMHAKCS